MDALSNLYPTVQIGSDGFQWWIGQIESERKKDRKGSGRYKVRIVGLHPQSCDAVRSDDLPWAITMMPVTNPHVPGGHCSVSDQLEEGVWVVGFYLDVDKQQPVIMGSIGQVAGSTSQPPGPNPTPDQDGCKSFTTFLSANTSNADQPVPANGAKPAPLTATMAGHPVTGEETRDPNGKALGASATSLTQAKEGKNSNSNPGGTNFCVEKAQICGKEKDLSGILTRLLGEMLYETQRNGGKLGTYLVGELSGEINDAISVGQTYVNKAIRVVRTFVASLKGFVLEKLKAGIKDLTNFLLGVTPTGNSLSPVTKFFNDILASVGCEIEDLGNRIAAFIQDLLFGYLFELYKAAACQVDKLVEGILNKIQSELQKILDAVLGPIQDILGSVASAIDIIGDTIAYVLDLLGIRCSGPPKQCSKVETVCTDCSTKKKDEDFLDNLIKDITDDLFPATGEDWSQYTCDEAYEGTTLEDTSVDVIGGTQPFATPPVIKYSIDDPTVEEGQVATFTITRSGYIDDASSVSYATSDGTATVGSDYVETSGILGFVAGQTSQTIQVQTFADSVTEGIENFFMTIQKETPADITCVADKNIGKCTIKESPLSTGLTPETPDGEDSPTPIFPPSTFNPSDPVDNTTTPPSSDSSDGIAGTDLDPVNKQVNYSVKADKVSVKEGEFVTFTITTKNVADGTVVKYQMFGNNITPSDVIGNTLNGSFTVENNIAQVVVGIAQDAIDEYDETLIFGIPGTAAKDSVKIVGNLDDLSLDDKLDALDSSSNIDGNNGIPKKPVIGTPITDAGGGILELPIEDPGDPYTIPPVIIVTGNGNGAAATPLLDELGFLTEIRVTNPGRSYKLNTPQTAGKECIIDSFTLLNTGRQYTSAPTVYVNGDSTVAEALINSDGLVISVRIKNRSLTFDSYPEVLILGGGGYGAKVLPSLVCLGPADRVKVGSAKIGTGKYVDCP